MFSFQCILSFSHNPVWEKTLPNGTEVNEYICAVCPGKYKDSAFFQILTYSPFTNITFHSAL
jgi:hypothetical protein